jgi:hypothetical protein
MFISASLYTLSDSEIKVETAQAIGEVKSLWGENLPTGVQSYVFFHGF